LIEINVSSGGNTGHKDSGNGEGGYSYVSLKLTDIQFKDAAHYGPGEILIIPAISGCGCDYRCVALDQFLSETKCLCPQGWLLSNDSKSCISKYNPTILSIDRSINIINIKKCNKKNNI